jgi:hypothetical protein
MSSLHPPGSLVRHINRPDVPIWIVIGNTPPKAHLLRSLPTTDPDGITTYEIINGNSENLILILGPRHMMVGRYQLD